MEKIKFESSVVAPADLQPFLEKEGLQGTVEHLTEPHRGPVESVLHFVSENIEAIQLFIGIFSAFKWWLEHQKLQLEQRKDAREAEKHAIEAEMKRLELLERKAALRLTLKNGSTLVLLDGSEEEIARQLEQEAKRLKLNQIKGIELR